MDKSAEVIMTTAVSILVPLFILYLQELISRRKEARETAAKTQRIGEAIAHDLSSLKSTVDTNATVLRNISDDIVDVRERLARVEGKVNS